MLFIRHRVNALQELDSCAKEWGVEIDVRAGGANGDIILAHDPWQTGESLVPWLTRFKESALSGPIFINTKDDGLEPRLLQLLAQEEVKDFYFVDTPVPTLVRWVLDGKGRHFAVRHSAFEPVESALAFEGKCRWVWVDCFQAKPVAVAGLERLKSAFKICLVSPELHAGPLESIAEFADHSRLADAVCTKAPERWQQILR